MEKAQWTASASFRAFQASQSFPRWTVGSIVKFKNGYSMRRARDRCEKGEKEEMMEEKGKQNRGLCSGDSVGPLYCIMIAVCHDTKRAHTQRSVDLQMGSGVCK